MGTEAISTPLRNNGFIGMEIALRLSRGTLAARRPSWHPTRCIVWREQGAYRLWLRNADPLTLRMWAFMPMSDDRLAKDWILIDAPHHSL